MADEIRYMLSVTSTKGAAVEQFPTVSTTFDQSTQGADGGIVEIGTSEEDLAITDVTTPGLLWMRNMDGTNYVEWGPKSGGVMILCGKMTAQGPPATFELGGSVTIRLKANTAACKVQWRVLST